jgi:hypothetical protein
VGRRDEWWVPSSPKLPKLIGKRLVEHFNGRPDLGIGRPIPRHNRRFPREWRILISWCAAEEITGLEKGEYRSRELHRKSGDPDFLHAALDTTACAVFFKETA